MLSHRILVSAFFLLWYSLYCTFQHTVDATGKFADEISTLMELTVHVELDKGRIGILYGDKHHEEK